jgi:hypothetical protein
MIGKASIHCRETKDLLGVIEAPVGDIAHENQNNIEILGIDLVAVFQPLAHQTQNF